MRCVLVVVLHTEVGHLDNLRQVELLGPYPDKGIGALLRARGFRSAQIHRSHGQPSTGTPFDELELGVGIAGIKKVRRHQRLQVALGGGAVGQRIALHRIGQLQDIDLATAQADPGTDVADDAGERYAIGRQRRAGGVERNRVSA